MNDLESCNQKISNNICELDKLIQESDPDQKSVCQKLTSWWSSPSIRCIDKELSQTCQKLANQLQEAVDVTAQIKQSNKIFPLLSPTVTEFSGHLQKIERQIDQIPVLQNRVKEYYNLPEESSLSSTLEKTQKVSEFLTAMAPMQKVMHRLHDEPLEVAAKLKTTFDAIKKDTFEASDTPYSVDDGYSFFVQNESGEKRYIIDFCPAYKTLIKKNNKEKFFYKSDQSSGFKCVGKGAFKAPTFALAYPSLKLLVKCGLYQKELDALNDLQQSENIVKLAGVFRRPKLAEGYMQNAEPRSYWVFTEYCSGSDLHGKFHHLDKYQKLIVMRDLVCGVKSMHDKGWCHRDLKFGNIFLSPELDQKNRKIYRAKIGDFGFATKDKVSKNWRGTPHYLCDFGDIKAKNIDGFKQDAYALGVVLYQLMYGKFPFQSYIETKLPNNSSKMINKKDQFTTKLRELHEQEMKKDKPWHKLFNIMTPISRIICALMDPRKKERASVSLSCSVLEKLINKELEKCNSTTSSQDVSFFQLS